MICEGNGNGGRWFAVPLRESGPVVKLARTAAQDVPAGGFFLIAWDEVISDTHGLYDSAINGVANLPPGFYHVDVSAKFPITDEAVMTNLYLERLGAGGWSTHLQSSDLVATGDNAFYTLSLSGIARIGVGTDNALRVRIRHTDTVTRQTGDGDFFTQFQLHRIGG